MNILICGAQGFIGQALEKALMTAGHTVIRGVRRPERETDIMIDYRHGTHPAWWVPHLNNIDIVINAVGIITEDSARSFEVLHEKAPKALFTACVQAGIRHIIQISALGAKQNAATPYLRSKAAADAHLRVLPICSTIIQPSLVFGENGKSSQFFMMLASLPVCIVPEKGTQNIQPVHIDDLADAIVRILAIPTPPLPVTRTVPVVGARPLLLLEMLSAYRKGLGLFKAPVIRIPGKIVECFMRWKPRSILTLLNTDTLIMLREGNIGDSQPLSTLLARRPRSIETFISSRPMPTWVLRMVDYALASLWIGSAIVSITPSGSRIGFDLISQSGIPDKLSTLSLYGGATLDFILGTLCLLRPTARLWYIQIIVVLLYTLFISVQLPAYWLHPFGPVLKNLPVLALLILALSLPRKNNATKEIGQ